MEVGFQIGSTPTYLWRMLPSSSVSKKTQTPLWMASRGSIRSTLCVTEGYPPNQVVQAHGASLSFSKSQESQT